MKLSDSLYWVAIAAGILAVMVMVFSLSVCSDNFYSYTDLIQLRLGPLCY